MRKLNRPWCFRGISCPITVSRSRPMQGVDQALARIYQRGARERPGVPPAPHVAVAAPASVPLVWPATILSMERQFGDRFERLAETLLLVRDRQLLKVVLFTSCHRAEGRTTLVLTLARALARHPGRFLLVDADLTGPMLARQLGLRPETGIDDVIEGGRPLGEALYEAVDDHLTVLPLRA